MRRLAVAATLSLALLPSAAARAGVYADVLHVYQQTGSIPACRFSSAQLSTALKGIDTYGQQYFADFANAVQAALSARASGACAPVAPVAPVAARAASSALRAPSGVATPPLPSSVTAPTDGGVPVPILLMTAVVVIVAVVLAVRSVAVATGWEPRWALRWRHAWGEAGYRVGGGWSDFRDWLRSRR